MIVMKFGGSSIAGAERVKAAAGIVRGRLPDKPVVVASAFRGVTDDLLALAREALAGRRERLAALRRQHYQIAEDLKVERAVLEPCFEDLSDLVKGIALLKELTPRTLDLAAGFGERLSTRIIASCLSRSGVAARQFDADLLGLVTDERFGQAAPLPEAEANIRRGLEGVAEVPVVTGYIGRTKSGDATTLGRNGSDFTATILGAALRAREVQIWSDTDGIMTADPRAVPSARPIEVLSFDEACELAYYGGRVLHPHTLVPAMKRDIPVRVLNTFKPDHPGTLIVARPKNHASGIRSIAFRRRHYLMTISSPRMATGPGFLARIFETLARHGVSVGMVSTSEVTVSITTHEPAGAEEAAAELRQEFEVSVEKDRAVVCVVGEGLRSTPGVAGEVFSVLKDARVNVLMISQGASKTNIAFVVDGGEVQKAVAALHQRLFPQTAAAGAN